MQNPDTKNIDLEERKRIWIVLSDLYLDTELLESDYKYMAKAFANSIYDLEKIKKINKYEVFPFLHWNLLSVAGVWTGFQEEWLVTKITKWVKRGNVFEHIWASVLFFFLGGVLQEDWEKIQNWYGTANHS